jgi:hypothetical protein
VLEFSNGLLMLNPADDELVLYNPDLVTSVTSIFLLTNQINQAADDADYTIYPLEPYRYNISYDYPDSGSRLIGSIGTAGGCEEALPALPEDMTSNYSTAAVLWHFSYAGDGADREWSVAFLPSNSKIKNLVVAVRTQGNNSSATSAIARVYENTTGGETGHMGAQVGSDMILYKDGIPGTPFPSTTTEFVFLQMERSALGPTITVGRWYYLALIFTHSMTAANRVGWILKVPAGFNTIIALARGSQSFNNGATWDACAGYLPGTVNLPQGATVFDPIWNIAYGGQDACGGSQSTIDADPVFCVAHDRNMSNRLGVVERVISGIPTHIKTAQTLNEYLYNKLYYAAKPRFTFDFPSVTMSNKIPKAGDIVVHVDSKARVGTQTAPIQTGVISSVQYSFEQGKGTDDALGLRRLSLQTTGIKRGSY